MSTLVKSTLLAAAVALGVAEASAQAPLVPRYRFGVSAGANIADMTETTGADTRTGAIIGGVLRVRLNAQFAFQPELYYSQKGVTGEFDDEGTTIDVELKNDYLEMPLLARWSPLTTGNIRPFALGGPSLAVSLSCEAEGASDGVSASVDCDEFADLNTFDLGALVGGGFEFPVGTRAMSVGARYTFGFNEVFDGTDSKNRALTFLVGFTF
jgi:hypothetical protein